MEDEKPGEPQYLKPRISYEAYKFESPNGNDEMYKKIANNFLFYLKKEKRKLLNIIPGFRIKPIDKIPKISAYLSIYNDSDILDAALNSIRPYVDELIVIDGAYEWMAPFLRASGRDPERSDESVYEKLRSSGIPYKIISKVWKNEVEKRIFGFSETKNRYVMRIDADEVIFFDDAALRSFFNSNCAVAEMFMPTYVAPGFVIKGRTIIDYFRGFPRQCFLFDKSKISAEEHLRYLWLVLTVDLLPELNQKTKIYSVFERPISFCAHLTNWRYVESSASRSSFYTMNWMRENGAPWIKHLQGNPISNFESFFEIIPPSIFLEVMRNGAFIQGDILLKSGEKLAPSPLDLADEKIFSGLYKKYLDNLSDRVSLIQKRGSHTLLNYPMYFDISTVDGLKKLASNDEIAIEFSCQINAATVSIFTFNNCAPFSSESHISYKISGFSLLFKIPPIEYDEFILRKAIKICVSSDTAETYSASFKFL